MSSCGLPGDGPGPGGLSGLRVLVPRGGPWGAAVAADLRARGAEPLVVPLVGVAPPDDPGPFDTAVHDLRRGAFDWLVVTSVTTVDALTDHGATVPAITRVAAVGATTRAACELAGIRVDLVPAADHSAQGLAVELPTPAGRVLLPQSDLADPGLARALTDRGAQVTAVVAYRTVPVAVEPDVRALAAAGRIGAVLVTSGSVARQLVDQLGPLPTTIVACLGPRTADEARAVGLTVTLVAPERTAAALVAALAAHVGG